MATAKKTATKNVVRSGAKNLDINSLIAERAYRIFEERGYTHGHDLDDWLEAERQVIAELKRKRSRVL